jgi:hypothetical protein
MASIETRNKTGKKMEIITKRKRTGNIKKSNKLTVILMVAKAKPITLL